MQGRQRIAEAWATILGELGYEPSDPHLRDTPERVARFMLEWHTNQADPPKLTTFENRAAQHYVGDKPVAYADDHIGGMIVTDRIAVASMCAHHGLPFDGVAVIGYIPDQHVLGLSKFARIADHFAHRFQVQERLTEQIANHLYRELKPKGLGVVTRMEHHCMSMRGANKPGARTTYSALRGLMFDDSKARSEFMALATGE